MKKLFSLLLCTAMLLSVLTGCGSSSSDTTASTAGTDEGDAAELRDIDVVLDWYPNALHTFLYTAIDRGYFADEGLNVNIRFPANENDALSLVAAGKAEIGLYYQHDIIQAVANQNIHVKSIGAVVQSPLNIILALKEKNIHSPADLVGKTVGYAGTAMSEALVKTMMEAVGADYDSVNMVNVGFELMSSMTTGNVDATIGCLVNHEVPELEHEGFDVDYFLVNEYGIPNYYEAVFLASDDMIAQEPEVLQGFLRACAKGFADFQADPDGCLQILLDNQNAENFPLTPEVEQQSCETLLPLMETDSAKFLSQSADVWQENIDWMVNAGLIDHAVEVSDVMVDLGA